MFSAGDPLFHNVLVTSAALKLAEKWVKLPDVKGAFGSRSTQLLYCEQPREEKSQMSHLRQAVTRFF